MDGSASDDRVGLAGFDKSMIAQHAFGRMQAARPLVLVLGAMSRIKEVFLAILAIHSIFSETLDLLLCLLLFDNFLLALSSNPSP
jgi:amino acid transporter